MQLDPIDPGSATPPFEQVRAQIARKAASGDLPPGTRLPSVRALATQLRLATNTVARVYRELETDGVVITEGRKGTSVAPTREAGAPEALAAADTYISRARRLGLERAEALRLVETRWAG